MSRPLQKEAFGIPEPFALTERLMTESKETIRMSSLKKEEKDKAKKPNHDKLVDPQTGLKIHHYALLDIHHNSIVTAHVPSNHWFELV